MLLYKQPKAEKLELLKGVNGDLSKLELANFDLNDWKDIRYDASLIFLLNDNFKLRKK